MVQYSRAVPRQWGDIAKLDRIVRGAYLNGGTVSSQNSHDAMAAISQYVNRTNGRKVRHGWRSGLHGQGSRPERIAPGGTASPELDEQWADQPGA
jgi:hypothetical protein